MGKFVFRKGTPAVRDGDKPAVLLIGKGHAYIPTVTVFDRVAYNILEYFGEPVRVAADKAVFIFRDFKFRSCQLVAVIVLYPIYDLGKIEFAFFHIEPDKLLAVRTHDLVHELFYLGSICGNVPGSTALLFRVGIKSVLQCL